MRSEERKNELGEVFTPPELVEEILDQLPSETWTDPTKTFLEPSCGNGNFLVALKERLLKHGHEERQVLERLHGVDLMQDNIDETKDRLDPDRKYRDILDLNIVCADGLKYHYRFDGTPCDPTPEEKNEEHFNNMFEIA